MHLRTYVSMDESTKELINSQLAIIDTPLSREHAIVATIFFRHGPGLLLLLLGTATTVLAVDMMVETVGVHVCKQASKQAHRQVRGPKRGEVKKEEEEEQEEEEEKGHVWCGDRRYRTEPDQTGLLH